MHNGCVKPIHYTRYTDCVKLSHYSQYTGCVKPSHITQLWRSIASDEDVSESYGVSAAQSWTRKCDHTGGMQQQPLGQVFFLCGPGAYDRDPANVSFRMPGHPYEHQVAMRNGLRQEFPNSVWIGRRPPRMLSGNP